MTLSLFLHSYYTHTHSATLGYTITHTTGIKYHYERLASISEDDLKNAVC